MTHDEIVEVVLAHKEGKRIEGRFKGASDESWVEVTHINQNGFNFLDWEYRIKEEEDIKEGDLVFVSAKPNWDNYIYVVRVQEITSSGIYGQSFGRCIKNSPACFSFEHNEITKLTI